MAILYTNCRDSVAKVYMIRSQCRLFSLFLFFEALLLALFFKSGWSWHDLRCFFLLYIAHVSDYRTEVNVVPLAQLSRMVDRTFC